MKNSHSVSSTSSTMKLLPFNDSGLRVLVTLLLCFEVTGTKTMRPKVTIPQGTLQGVTLQTRNNRSIFGFQGIPYAQPPIDNLRFKAPVAAGGWNGIFDAGSDGSPCIQSPTGVIFGSEDCLCINVYTPKLPEPDSTLLPVMVFIHGGQFLQGSNDYDTYNPKYFLEKNILLVNPNYRLGAMGFLSTGDEVAPGNWGLKDQILALKWVQNNIQYFGGDPDRVTLVGESAGGASLELLALSNATEGLFHRYITQSGLAISTQQFQLDPSKYAFQLGEYLGCTTASTSTLLIECLRKFTATEITGANTIFLKWDIFPIVTWAPVVEPNIEGAVVTCTPQELLVNGRIRDMPAIVGWDRDDGFAIVGGFYGNSTKFDEFLCNIDDYLPYVLNYHNSLKNVTAITSALKSYYFNNDLTTNRTELLANLTLLAGDALSRFPSYQTLQHGSSSSRPWYMFSFDYHGALSFTYTFYRLFLSNIVCHSDELIYLFSMSNSPYFAGVNKTMSNKDFEMVDEMVELWTSFVISGVPYSGALGNRSWPRYSKSEQYLRIGDGTDLSLEVETSKFQDRMKFWQHLTAMLY